MSERTDTDKLAERLLSDDGSSIFPDDSLKILSRQLLRRREVIERMEKHLAEMQDPTLDMIHANRDAILRIHDEGLSRVRKKLEYLATSLAQSDSPPPIVIKDLEEHARLALKIIAAAMEFHPMHGESWSSWPPGSE